MIFCNWKVSDVADENIACCGTGNWEFPNPDEKKTCFTCLEGVSAFSRNKQVVIISVS